MLKRTLFLILLVSLVSCADDTTSPDGMADVKVISSMSNKSVYSSNNGAFQSQGVDSLIVTNFRILISAIKLHGYNEIDGKDESFKTGPYVLKADSTGSFYYLSVYFLHLGAIVC